MKKRVYVALSLVLVAAVAAVPAFTLSWIHKGYDYKVHLTSGTSVSTIVIKPTKRRVTSDATTPYQIDYDEVIKDPSISSVTLDDSTAEVSIGLDDIDFDYASIMTDSFGVDVNYFPRVYLELDILNEYFTSYLQTRISNFNFKMTTGNSTLDLSVDPLLDYRYQLISNNEANPMTEAISTYGKNFDSAYYDPTLVQGPSFTPIVDQCPDFSLFTVTVNGTTSDAQLSVDGFDTKVGNEAVFSKAVLLSIGINPGWFFEAVRSGKLDIRHSKLTFSISFSIIFKLSNQPFDGLEVIR